MIRKPTGCVSPVAAFFELANTPAEAGPFHAACERFARFDASSSADDLWIFSVDGLRLMVGVSDSRVIEYGVLSICWWETFHRSDHSDRLSWEAEHAEHAEFNQIYEGEVQAAMSILGRPMLIGQDRDSDGHRWAIWQGRTGLMILQQSAFDPQFGFDINYWLHPWQGEDPCPGSPFIDWLFSQHA